MSYASDNLYKGYLRKNMPRIVSTVKPREIVVHLPCLTDHDRETIEAKRETCGSFDAMVRLLDCLKRRDNWPEELIAALEACEHRIIAAEIRAEYDALRGINNSSHAPPAANVVTAHVHTAPSGPHLPPPGPTASAPPPPLDVPSEARDTQPIQETEKPGPQSNPAPAAAPAMEVISEPEPPKAQIEAVVVAPPVTPPPSPDLVRGSANPSPPPEQVNYIARQEPEEDLEPESLQAQNVANIQPEAKENTVLPQVQPCEEDDPTLTATMVYQSAPTPTTAIEKTPVINTVNEPDTITVMEDTAKPTNIAQEATTTVVNPVLPPDVAETSPGRSASPLTDLDDPILTPEKPPVQETTPTAPAVVPVIKKTAEPQNTQVAQIPQEIVAPPGPPLGLENGSGPAVSLDDEINFSKPGVLLSVAPPDQNNTTICPPSQECAPYSGDSGRLELSDDVLSCQGNGINHNNPDKEVSKSPAPSLEEDRIIVGHVAEEPSVLNNAIQSLQIQNTGESTKEITIAPPVAASTMTSDLSASIDPKESTALNLNDSKDPAVESSIPATSLISDNTPCTNEEDICESPAPSLDMDDVRENIGHVAEDPSILNLVQAPLRQMGDTESDAEFKAAPFGIAPTANFEQNPDSTNVQTPLIHLNGEPAKEIAPVPPNSNPPSNDTHKPNDPPIDPKQPGKTTRSLNTRYIMAAVGVGACALLIAWRFKH